MNVCVTGFQTVTQRICALDLLLVTDLTPKEFLFGKLGGVAWVTKEMVLLPVALCLYLLWSRDLSLQNFFYCVGGLLVLDVFVGMLGIHCGMTYANSRVAIGVSLGTVFFLFLGIATCIVMMISFSGAFQVQLAPFLAFIVCCWAAFYWPSLTAISAKPIPINTLLIIDG